MVFDHIGLEVSDFNRAKSFLVQALAPLGFAMTSEGDGRATMGRIGPDGHNIEAVCHAPEA
jgi:catechol 2,3-dioxygenase-like lactoylglutathione lyase family enzyme